MQENNEQIQAVTDTAAEHPAGEMKLPKASSIGARARALSGLALGLGAALLAVGPDTTIRPPDLFG
ncbi:hypothetical protein AB0J80_37900 [Actinoplanes sp. NPDC049548]|uniref:hypothetical protein n=1 Tax=Actinoplanes sp. NPDC049548 TaxID=3155152 RepID=UPI00341EF6DD